MDESRKLKRKARAVYNPTKVTVLLRLNRENE